MIFIRTGTEKTDSDRETHSPHTFCNSVHSGGCPLISLDVFGHLWDILKIYKQHYFALFKQKKKTLLHGYFTLELQQTIIFSSN